MKQLTATIERGTETTTETYKNLNDRQAAERRLAIISRERMNPGATVDIQIQDMDY